VAPPVLGIAEGQPVEITVTSGPQKQPLANLTIYLRREHDYTWLENGEEQSGSGGPQWWATTDESGKAVTRTLPGKLGVSIYEPRWRTEQSIDVVEGKPATVTLHRDVGEKQTVMGQIVLDATKGAKPEDVDIRVGSLDPNYQDEQSLQPGADGKFVFETFASQIGVFASTKDGKAAGAVVTSNLDSPIVVRLQATGECQGQLLGAGDQPAVSHPVRAFVRLEGTRMAGARFPEHFEVKRVEARTDDAGNFTLAGIPKQIKGSLRADAIDGSSDDVYLGEFYLEPGESRPRTVSQLEKTHTAETKIPLAERYQTTLRDCALGGYRPIVIIGDGSEGVSRFINQNYSSSKTNKDVYAFMQIIVAGGKVPLEAADVEFLKSRGWPESKAGCVFACALDANGNELGQLEIDINQSNAAEEAARFIQQHAPERHDAEEKWSAAFAEAERTGRRVWVRVSQRYCGPCFRMSRWIDDLCSLLEKDYVMLKIDDVRDVHGAEVAERVVQGQQAGVPFHAIFDATGTLLIDSNGPLGNVGHPSGIEGKRHLKKMLLETRQKLTDEEVERLVESVGGN
jgi:hypothetical protein